MVNHGKEVPEKMLKILTADIPVATKSLKEVVKTTNTTVEVLIKYHIAGMVKSL